MEFISLICKTVPRRSVMSKRVRENHPRSNTTKVPTLDDFNCFSLPDIPSLLPSHYAFFFRLPRSNYMITIENVPS